MSQGVRSFDATRIATARCLLRPWRMSDAPLLPPIADDKRISWNTSYKFPHPFDTAAALKYLTFQTAAPGNNAWQFAIWHNHKLIGGCGCIRGTDVQSHTALTGYWLGVDYWGKGITTEVLSALVTYMTENTDVEKLTATVYGWNPASRRVLEKCGYINEGIAKNAVRKWGQTTDLWLFGRPLP